MQNIAEYKKVRRRWQKKLRSIAKVRKSPQRDAEDRKRLHKTAENRRVLRKYRRNTAQDRRRQQKTAEERTKNKILIIW